MQHDVADSPVEAFALEKQLVDLSAHQSRATDFSTVHFVTGSDDDRPCVLPSWLAAG